MINDGNVSNIENQDKSELVVDVSVNKSITHDYAINISNRSLRSLSKRDASLRQVTPKITTPNLTNPKQSVNNSLIISNNEKPSFMNSKNDKTDEYKISINQEIIKNGMAVIYNFGNGDPKLDELELQAKNNHLGIWRGAFQLPKDYRKSHKKS